VTIREKILPAERPFGIYKKMGEIDTDKCGDSSSENKSLVRILFFWDTHAKDELMVIWEVLAGR